MQKVQRHHSKEFKHSFAYDEYGSCIPFHQSVNDGRKYFFDKEKQIQLMFKTSKIGNGFWAAYPKQFYRDQHGKQYAFKDLENKLSESMEHLDFKRNIIHEGFFYYKSNKVFIENTKEEGRIINSRYESDVSGQLLDGTYCIIEVIKTSDLSQKKYSYIQDSQILTFKIYIDEYGNQKHEHDRITGNREIEQITESIQKGEGQLAELRQSNESERARAKKESFARVEEYRKRIDAKIEDLKRQFEPFKQTTGREIHHIERRNEHIKSEIEQIKSEISRINGETSNSDRNIKENRRIKKGIEDDIKRTKDQIAFTESKFEQIGENCKIEWFRNQWMKSPVKDLIKELKYWTA